METGEMRRFAGHVLKLGGHVLKWYGLTYYFTRGQTDGPLSTWEGRGEQIVCEVLFSFVR